ncbi:hypothetical protein BpHYR1_026128 [Brachionus plicatilis]|uniref:Uncharacterized protein n=1 Tax=Brachionus plicatilis TaxID=10195 RepID=A0A3M7T7R1_BRAPC|nr:hypothetical protein BpHYR1_026128 [Brachionus plicatilis]
MVKESFSEVSAFVVSHFNERCNLAVHNCLFRTEWDKVFGKDRLDSKYHYLKRSNGQNGNETYYYCQAFVIGRFCIDDYLAKSTDNFECLNGTNDYFDTKIRFLNLRLFALNILFKIGILNLRTQRQNKIIQVWLKIKLEIFYSNFKAYANSFHIFQFFQV